MSDIIQKEKVKKRLKAKLEIAKFLQDTVEESALVKSGTGKHTELAKEFQTFLTQVSHSPLSTAMNSVQSGNSMISIYLTMTLA